MTVSGADGQSMTLPVSAFSQMVSCEEAAAEIPEATLRAEIAVGAICGLAA